MIIMCPRIILLFLKPVELEIFELKMKRKIIITVPTGIFTKCRRRAIKTNNWIQISEHFHLLLIEYTLYFSNTTVVLEVRRSKSVPIHYFCGFDTITLTSWCSDWLFILIPEIMFLIPVRKYLFLVRRGNHIPKHTPPI